jgi:ureidoglycolate lyase
VLGGPPDLDSPDHFDSETTRFWAEHDFEVGEGGDVQLLWVNYRWRGFEIQYVESHRLTEQAIIPVTGDPIVHVVCPPPDDLMAPDIVPDLDRMQAFLLDGSKGVCMKKGCWHAHRSLRDEATYLMITRRTTTTDILDEKRGGAETTETVVWEIGALTEDAFELVF